MLRAEGHELLLRTWLSVGALSVDQLFAWGALFYAFSVLAAPLSDGLGLSRTFVAGAFSVGLALGGLLARPVGEHLDRRGARGVLRAGAVAGIGGLGLLAIASGPGTLLVAFAALGVAQALSLYDPAFRVVVDWFDRPASRGRALLLLTSVAGFASAVFVPLTSALVVGFGWRAAVVLLAVGLACVLVPARWGLPVPDRDVPRQREAPRSGTTPPSVRWLALGFALHALASAGVALGLVWQRVERGDPVAHAAAVAGLLGAAQVPGRLVFGALRPDRVTSWIPALLGAQALALLGIAAGVEPWATGSVVAFGATSGVMTLERAHVLIAWYGPDRFGAHNGRLGTVSVVARAVAPLAVELLHTAGTYSTSFAVLAAGLALGAGSAVVAGRARTTEGTTEGTPPAPRQGVRAGH